MKLTRIPHLEGDPGVEQTIRQMRRLIDQGKKDPEIHELAAQIIRRLPADDGSSAVATQKARAIFDAVSRNVRFTFDVHGNETLHAAADIVRLGIGDCDDFTVLICSLLKTAGADCRIVTIATDPSGEFSHVYPEAEINGQWIALDAARKFAAFGKSPSHYTRKRAWSVDSEGYADMSSLSSSLRGMGDGRQNIAPGEGPQGAWRQSVYPPFRAAAARAAGTMTGTYLSEFPVAPPHQRFHRPPIGVGNYGVPAARRFLSDFSCGDLRRTLGQWGDCAAGDTACEIANIIQASTQGVSNVITASRATPYNLFPNLTPGASGGGRAYPAGAYGPGAVYGGGAPTVFSGINPTTLLIGGGLLLLVVAGRR
jgi:Transglutaminase-like superfamily